MQSPGSGARTPEGSVLFECAAGHWGSQSAKAAHDVSLLGTASNLDRGILLGFSAGHKFK